MTTPVCQQCAAPIRGLICEYCGSLTQLGTDLATEKQALVEYHNILQNQEPDRQVQLLLNGFLPDHTAVLIEAGMRCIPLIDTSDPADEKVGAATKRLRAIVVKLRLLAQNEQAEKAIVELEAVLNEYKRADKQLNWIVAGMFLFLGLACVAVIWLWLIL